MSTQAAAQPRRLPLPFHPDPHRDRLLLSGHITSTIRSRRVAWPSDVFLIYHLGLYCQIEEVHALPLARAAALHYATSGFDSPSDLLEDWQQVHPFIGKQMTRRVFVYKFHQIASPYTTVKKVCHG